MGSTEKNSLKSGTEVKLDHLLKLIEKLVTRDVAPVAPVLPVAPVAPVLPVAPILATNLDNQILLAKLDTKVDQIQETISEIKKEMVNSVSSSEYDALVLAKDDHEIRLRVIGTNVTRILTWGSILVFIIGFVEFAMLFLKGRV